MRLFCGFNGKMNRTADAIFVELLLVLMGYQKENGSHFVSSFPLDTNRKAEAVSGEKLPPKGNESPPPRVEKKLRREEAGPLERVHPEARHRLQRLAAAFAKTSHWLSGWPKKSPNFIFTTKLVFPKSLKFMNSGSE